MQTAQERAYKPSRYCFPIEIRHKAAGELLDKKNRTPWLFATRAHQSRNRAQDERRESIYIAVEWTVCWSDAARRERDTHTYRPTRAQWLAACPYRFSRRQHRCAACSVAISHSRQRKNALAHMPAVAVQTVALICVCLRPS